MAIAARASSDRAVGIFVDLPFAVVHDEEIEQAVVVVIEPARARRPHFFPVQGCPLQPRLLGHISEGSILVVVEELVAGDVRENKSGHPSLS